MRTTLNLDDQLVSEAKAVAARSGRTLSQVIEDALRAALSRRAVKNRRQHELPTSPGTPRPGVDLDDGAGLRSLMDQPPP
jgi:hypothetical protein